MILDQQYEMVRRSRERVFRYVENEIGNDLTTPISVYNNKSIRDLLVHNAACYDFWVSKFIFQRHERSLTGYSTVPKIRELYKEIDDLVAEFLNNFSNDLNKKITSTPDEWGPRTATPLEVFTHVVTHEFHHKGQILSMGRQLGHVPPDTDVIAID